MFSGSKVFICTIIIVVLNNTKAEVYSAIADIEILLNIEKDFTKLLKHYLEYEEARLEMVKKISGSLHHRIFQNIPDESVFLYNPVNVFHLIQDMNFDLSSLFYYMKKTSLKDATQFLFNETQSFDLPHKKDLNGISVALSRLEYTYKMPVTTIANGNFVPNGPPIKELSAEDCYDIGFQLFSSQMFKKAISWFQEALEREIREKHKPIQRHSILNLLANATYQTHDNVTYNNVLATIEELDKEHNQNNLKLYKDLYDKVNLDCIKHNITLQDKSFYALKRFRRNRQKTDMLCRNEQIVNRKFESKLNCYFSVFKSPFLRLQPVKIEDVHFSPWITVFHDVISDHKIRIIKSLSLPKLDRAQVGEGNYADFRISKSAWLGEDESNAVKTLAIRLQEITGLDLKLGAEDLQVVNYGIGGHYDTHHDYDDSIPLGGSTESATRGKRIATILIYMSDVKAGGATVFPHLNLSVTPVKGSAVFWYNLLMTGELDVDTEHAGCPVIGGSKWVSNKWIVEHHQEFRRPCGVTEYHLYEK